MSKGVEWALEPPIHTNAVNGPMRLFVNNGNTNGSLAFQLRDESGNHSGIGGKIKIAYGADAEW